MTQLMINDLSVTEELGRNAMAAIAGGKREYHMPRGNAYGRFGKEPILVPLSNTQTIQQGLSVINITGDGAAVISSVSNSGSVNFSANNSATF